MAIHMGECGLPESSAYVSLAVFVVVQIATALIIAIGIVFKIRRQTITRNSRLAFVAATLTTGSGCFGFLLAHAAHRDRCLGHWYYTFALLIGGVFLAVADFSLVLMLLLDDFCLDFRTIGGFEIRNAQDREARERAIVLEEVRCDEVPHMNQTPMQILH